MFKIRKRTRPVARSRRSSAGRTLTFESLENRKVLAGIYYVDATAGNDANDGFSPGTAWSTLSKVENKSFAPGDQILLKRGAAWNDTFDIKQSGTEAQPITFGAYGSGADPIVFRVIVTGSNAIVQDMVVDHGNQLNDAVQVRSGKNVVLRNMEVRNGAADGIDVDKADGLVIDGLHIHHFLAGSFTTQADAHGIVATATVGLTIRNTEIHHVSGDSFQADPARGSTITTDVLIEDSHFWTSPLDADFNLWRAGERPGENAIDTKVADVDWELAPRMTITVRNIVAHGWQKDGYIANRAAFNMKEKIEAVFDGVTVYDSEIAFRLRGTRGNANVTLMNAVVYDVEKSIRAEDNLSNLKVYNSTFADGIVKQLEFAGGDAGKGSWQFLNNAYVGTIPSVATGTTNRLATASEFVDSPSRDYHLVETSTLIDAGVSIAAVGIDRDQVQRPQGAGFDVGAFERTVDPFDIVVHSFSGTGNTALTVTYEITGRDATAFGLNFVRSSDPTYAPDDLLLTTVTINSPSDLAVGVHTKTFTLGNGAGQIALPTAVSADAVSEYHLLVTADPTNSIEERDVDPLGEDNTAALSGVYHPPRGKLYVHGTANADSIAIQTGAVVLNGVSFGFNESDVQSLQIWGHSGADQISGQTATELLWINGGEGDDTLVGGTRNDTLIGGDGNDSLSGVAGHDTLIGEAGDDLLTGGIGNDTYTFDADMPLGSDTVVEVNAGGTDLLEFSATTTIGVSVDLGNATSQTVNANLALTLGAITIENVVGSSQADTIAGNSLANTITGGPGNDSLIGGVGNDVYSFDTDVALGIDTLVESTNGGTDHLYFAATSSLPVSVDLATSMLQAVNGNLSLVLSAADLFENVTGGSQHDSIIGNALANVLAGGNGNDSLTGADGNDVLNGGAGDDLLSGGNGNDVYSFDADTSLGTDTLVESIASGTDRLDFASTTTKGLNVNLSVGVPQIVNGNLTLILPATAAIEDITGGTQNDTLIGNGDANTLTGGAGDDWLDGADGADTLAGGIGNDRLTGGTGDDMFTFDADASLGHDTLEDAGGIDFLNFALTSTQAVAVDLSRVDVQVVNAFLNLTLAADIENIVGGAKNDTLIGNSLPNVLIGDGGNDLLIGGGGRDLLLGGSGTDTLRGGSDDDILAGGRSSFRSEGSIVVQQAAFKALMAEWTSTASYATRIDHLLNGGTGALNGSYRLNSTTVFKDSGAADQVFGEEDLDWWLASLEDVLNDREATETKSTI